MRRADGTFCIFINFIEAPLVEGMLAKKVNCGEIKVTATR